MFAYSSIHARYRGTVPMLMTIDPQAFSQSAVEPIDERDAMVRTAPIERTIAAAISRRCFLCNGVSLVERKAAAE